MGPHLHSFINLVELREYVTKELQTLHHTAPKNVIYICLYSSKVSKYIDMNISLEMQFLT